MNETIRIVGDCPRRIWGLTGRERLQRMLDSRPAGRAAGPAPDTVLLLRADLIYDLRLLDALAQGTEPLALHAGVPPRPVAARVPAAAAHGFAEEFLAGTGPGLAALPVRAPTDLVQGFERSLRKNEPPRVHDITATDPARLEAELFGGAYKGVTDLVTKWLWPAPAYQAVHLCIRLGLSPNHVTLIGLLLALLATACFAAGWFGTGLALGWGMTFLDTVDGKLARVTVTASRFGDYLDHGIDLLHPPVWYWAWGMGVAAQWAAPVSLDVALWLMLAGYVGGRLCEGAFHLFAGSFSLFVWRPLDSFNRLVTARRNPNLILLTLCWAAGHPVAGLLAVVGWHLLSTAFLFVRVAYAISVRLRTGPLQSWLATTDPARDRDRLAVRLFTRAPAAP